MTSSEGFQHHFSIISKFICCGFYMKKNVAFTLISFAVLKWDEYLSVQLPFELPVHIPVQLVLEPEVNWLDQNVNEQECRWNNTKSPPRVVTFYVLVSPFHSGQMKLVWDIGVWNVIGIFLPPFSWLWLLCRYCKILGSLSLVSIQKVDSRSITLVVWDVVRKMPRQRTC